MWRHCGHGGGIAYVINVTLDSMFVFPDLPLNFPINQ